MGRRKHVASSTLTIADLERMLREREAEISALQAKRDALAGELAGIDAQLAQVEGVPVKRGPGRPPKAGGVRRGPGRPPGKRGPGRPPKAEGARRGPGRPPGKRGPGRPPKAAGPRRGPGRPPGKRGPGRPRKAAAAPKAAADHTALYAAVRAAMQGGGAMKAAEIAKKVVDGGFADAPKAFHLVIGRRLAEMADVAKGDDGTYTLKS